jgi:hypothetical protein
LRDDRAIILITVQSCVFAFELHQMSA